MDYRVFISHSHQDYELARVMANRISEAGFQVFLMGDAKPGGQFQITKDLRNQLRRLLRSSDEVVILLTDYSVRNARVMLEMGFAFGMHKLVTIISDVRKEKLPFDVQKLRHYSYRHLDLYIAELERRSKLPREHKS